MSYYEKRILPKLINFACGLGPMMKQRAKVVPLAKGNVLEIGIGSGLNLGYYEKDKVKNLIGIDPSKETWALNEAITDKLGFDFQYIQTGAENIPIDNQSIDTVVITYTLCTIPSTMEALVEIKRVLKPTGQILFVEHGKAPDAAVLKWQNRINPLWKRIGGGCNLNRDIPNIFTKSGFKMNDLQTMYLPGWKPASFNYWGIVKPD
ncbi:MAG: class I SAM-dependent methyltransferase [Saprospiraceae bacterium]